MPGFCMGHTPPLDLYRSCLIAAMGRFYRRSIYL